MATIGNKKNRNQAAYEEMIYKDQLIKLHAKHIGDLDNEYTEEQIEQEIKRRKK